MCNIPCVISESMGINGDHHRHLHHGYRLHLRSCRHHDYRLRSYLLPWRKNYAWWEYRCELGSECGQASEFEYGFVSEPVCASACC